MTLLATTARPLIVGEILFDIFPNGHRILGGAPFNVAWHLQGFGLAPLIVSQIGQDAEGEHVLNAAQQWQLDTQLLQQSNTHPTGRVLVQLENGSPSYEIPAQQAYDFIDLTATATALEQITSPLALLYHGTLAFRHHDHAALVALAQRYQIPIFLDLNLRAPWWTPALVTQTLQSAHWVKLNEDELTLIMPTYQAEQPESGLQQFCQQYDLAMVILTRGAEGALLQIRDQPLLHSSSPQVAQLVDSVGAGDAFCSVILAGLLRRWPEEIMLARAVDFASRICQIQGATTMDYKLYQQVLDDWEALHTKVFP